MQGALVDRRDHWDDLATLDLADLCLPYAGANRQLLLSHMRMPGTVSARTSMGGAERGFDPGWDRDLSGDRGGLRLSSNSAVSAGGPKLLAARCLVYL